MCWYVLCKFDLMNINENRRNHIQPHHFASAMPGHSIPTKAEESVNAEPGSTWIGESTPWLNHFQTKKTFTESTQRWRYKVYKMQAMHIPELFGWSMALQVWWNSIASLWKRHENTTKTRSVSHHLSTSPPLRKLRSRWRRSERWAYHAYRSFTETIKHNSSKLNRRIDTCPKISGPVIGIADPIRVLESFRMICRTSYAVCYVDAVWLRDFPEEHGQSWKVSRKQGQQAPSNLDRPRRCLSVSTLEFVSSKTLLQRKTRPCFKRS